MKSNERNNKRYMKNCKKNAKTLLLILLISSLTGCSLVSTKPEAPVAVTNFYGDAEEFGEEFDEEDDDEQSENPTGVEINIKYSAFPGSKTPDGNDITNNTWIGKHELNEYQVKTIETDIIPQLGTYSPYIHITQNISEDDFNEAMIAMFTNYPEAFNIDLSYSYDLTINGYINNFYPKYIIPGDKYITLKDKLFSSKSNFRKSYLDTSTYNVVLEAINKTVEYDFSYEAPQKIDFNNSDEYVGYLSQQMGLPGIKQKLNSLGVAKTIKYYLDYIGVENIVVLGEFIDDSSTVYDSFSKEEMKIKGTSTTKTVSLNLNNYIAWNLVNIDGTWVNVDAYLNKFYANQNHSDDGALICCSDEVIRQSRIFMPTYNLIGSTPSCNSYQYQPFYRQNYFIVNYSSEDLHKCMKYLVDKAISLKQKNFNIQFETEANYQEFLETIDEVIIEANTPVENISTYTVYSNDKTLTAVLSIGIFKTY